MLRDSEAPQNSNLRGLVVGNYCHDVLLRDGAVIGETIGGSASFISPVFDTFSISHHLVAKVGPDFAYVTKHPPIVMNSFETTVFHAYFDSNIDASGDFDRVLKRVRACDAISASDLPESRFDFGMAVGVGGEILPETLERMVEICDKVFVDVQALIRGEETLLCFGDAWKEGCRVYWKDGDMEIAPFSVSQVDPTGAGDGFFGGFVAGLVQGLAVSDAAILGNFFGSLTVSQVGPPKLNTMLSRMVKDEIHKRRKTERNNAMLSFEKAHEEEQFYASLSAAKETIMRQI
ncbi:hypothetical protein K1719_044419 [Acacia pycnantha]|nr:hypothetical protein K1719_044419 [Acacia pycnantha]